MSFCAGMILANQAFLWKVKLMNWHKVWAEQESDLRVKVIILGLQISIIPLLI